jgi:signal transduction histidine kinase
VRPHVRVIPRDEALYRLSVLVAAICVAGVVLAILVHMPAVDETGMLSLTAALAIGSCAVMAVIVERLLSRVRRQQRDARAFSAAFRDLSDIEDPRDAREVVCRLAGTLTGASSTELTDRPMADHADPRFTDPTRLVAPLAHDGGDGALVLTFPRAPRRPEEVVEVTSLLASVASRTLQRIDLQATVRAHADDLEAVVDLARRLPRVGDAHEARTSICEGVLEVCGGMMAVLMEPDGAGYLVASATAGADSAPMRVSLDDEHSVTVSSFRRGEPYFMSDIPSDPAVDTRLATAVNAVSALWQPVIRDGETVGVLLVVWESQLDRLSERAAAVVGLFAAEAAVAIERADLMARMEGLNRMLRVQVEALRVSDQMKTDFVSSVSHELRTPLASIIGYLDVLMDGELGEIGGEQLEFMGIINENARRLLVLINDLLTLSGLESGRMVLRVEPVDMRTLVEQRVRDQLHLAETSEVQLSLGLPPEPVEAQVDTDRFGQVITNLLANAIKFTPAGGRVSVALGRSRGGVALSVSDTGIGIADDDQSRLFERFFRARNAADHSIPGTGLGLAICKGIVDAHGGSLAVESVLDEGTTVTVLLPTDHTTPQP